MNGILDTTSVKQNDATDTQNSVRTSVKTCALVCTLARHLEGTSHLLRKCSDYVKSDTLTKS